MSPIIRNSQALSQLTVAIFNALHCILFEWLLECKVYLRFVSGTAGLVLDPGPAGDGVSCRVVDSPFEGEAVKKL